jgi:hypothetical protein
MQTQEENPLAPLHLIIEPELAGSVGNPPGAALVAHHVAPAAAAMLRPVRIDQECVAAGPRDQNDAAGLGGSCQRAPGIAAGDHVSGQTGMPECFFLRGRRICFRKEKVMVPVPVEQGTCKTTIFFFLSALNVFDSVRTVTFWYGFGCGFGRPRNIRSYGSGSPTLVFDLKKARKGTGTCI